MTSLTPELDHENHTFQMFNTWVVSLFSATHFKALKVDSSSWLLPLRPVTWADQRELLCRLLSSRPRSSDDAEGEGLVGSLLRAAPFCQALLIWGSRAQGIGVKLASTRGTELLLRGPRYQPLKDTQRLDSKPQDGSQLEAYTPAADYNLDSFYYF